MKIYIVNDPLVYFLHAYKNIHNLEMKKEKNKPERGGVNDMNEL